MRLQNRRAAYAIVSPLVIKQFLTDFVEQGKKMTTSLQKGVSAAKIGNKKLALQHIKQAVAENPQDITAWLWASVLIDNVEKKQACLERVLKIDPQNKDALREMAKLSSRKKSPLPSPPQRQEKAATPLRQNAQRHKQNKSSDFLKKATKKISTWAKIGIGLTIVYFVISVPLLAILASSPEGFSATSELPASFNIIMFLSLFPAGHYIISGYLGAYKLSKNSPSLSCMTFVLFGWIILIVPWFLGWFLLWWANRVERKNAKQYKQCQSCGSLMPANVMYCPSCGKLVR